MPYLSRPYYTILYYTILYYTILCYTIPHYTIKYYTMSYHTTILYSTVLSGVMYFSIPLDYSTGLPRWAPSTSSQGNAVWVRRHRKLRDTHRVSGLWCRVQIKALTLITLQGVTLNPKP